ncbi:MAG: hypothetical protein ACFB20_01070 [Opitutales bacterium]
MSQLSDKVLFIIALVILGSAFAFMFVSQGGLDRSADAEVAAPPTGFEYSDVTADVVVAGQPAWQEPAPPADDPLEFYDLFTPPRIFWDAREREFVFIPITPEVFRLPIPFGAKMVAFEPLPYRIQFDSYLGRLPRNPTNEPPNAQFFFKVVPEPGQPPITIQGYPDETDEFAPYGFRVVSGREELREVMEKEGTANMEFRRVGFVTIFDEQLGEEVVLDTDSVKETTGEFLLTFEQNVRPFDQFRLQEPGETFGFTQAAQTWDDAEVSYELLRLLPETRQAEIVKTEPRLEGRRRLPEGQEPLQQILGVERSERGSAPRAEPRDETTLPDQPVDSGGQNFTLPGSFGQ